MPKRPQTHRELLLQYPFELCLSFMLLLSGIRSVVPNATQSRAVDHALGPWLSFAWQGAVILGSALILGSLLVAPNAAHRGLAAEAKNRAFEQSGLVLMATGAAVYVVVLIAAAGTDVMFPLAQSFGIGAACVLRIVQLKRYDAGTLRRLQAINQEVADDDDGGDTHAAGD